MDVATDHKSLLRFVAARTADAEANLYGADERRRSETALVAHVRALELILAACVRNTAEPALVRTVEPTIRGSWERPEA